MLQYKITCGKGLHDSKQALHDCSHCACPCRITCTEGSEKPWTPTSRVKIPFNRQLKGEVRLAFNSLYIQHIVAKLRVKVASYAIPRHCYIKAEHRTIQMKGRTLLLVVDWDRQYLLLAFVFRKGGCNCKTINASIWKHYAIFSL